MRWLSACLALAISSTQAQTPPRGDPGSPARAVALSDDQERAGQVARLFSSYETDGAPGCEVGVVRDGARLYESGFGWADPQRRTHIDRDSIFNIASVSKQFTAFSIFLLEARGKLSLEDSLTRHLPELGHYANAVKLRHLVAHTAGVREYFVILSMGGRTSDDVVTDEETLQALARQSALNFTPGDEYSYSNSGYFLLAKVVERASGQRFHDFVRTNIFEPLGMTSTSIGPPDDPRLAIGHEVRDGAFHRMYVPWEQIGESDVHTTLSDLLRWDENFYTAAVGGKAIIARMLTTASLSSGKALDYAGGLMIGNRGGLPSVAHSGFSQGFRAQLLRFPQQHLSVALLCNRDDAEVEREADRIAEIYLGRQLQPANLPSDLEDLQIPGAVDISRVPAGAYRNERRGDYLWLIHRDGKVLLQVGDEVEPLERVTEQLFAVQLQGAPRYATALPARNKQPARVVARYYGKPGEYTHVQTWQPTHLERYAGIYFAKELNATYKLVVRDGALALDTGRAIGALRPGVRGEFVGADWRTIRVPTRGYDHFIFSIPELRGIRFERTRESNP